MRKKEKASIAVEKLEQIYPNPKCSLIYQEPYQLLLATRLAAQCTDERVNKVTKVLFEKYPDIESLANADISDVEKIVHPCGVFRVKSRDLINICKKLISDFNSEVPNNMDSLLSLPGVGRKTANLVLGDIFNMPAVVCDTHCIRITNLLGLTDSKNPAIVENQLKKILEPSKSNNFCHRLVMHGRAVCVARNPKCEICNLSDICTYYQKNNKKNQI